jgi:hypothetical protein
MRDKPSDGYVEEPNLVAPGRTSGAYFALFPIGSSIEFEKHV